MVIRKLRDMDHWRASVQDSELTLHARLSTDHTRYTMEIMASGRFPIWFVSIVTNEVSHEI